MQKQHGVPVTFALFQQRLNDKFGARFTLLEFNGMTRPCTFICPEHGEQHPKSSANSLLKSKHGCPACGWAATSKACNLPREVHLERLRAAGAEKYEVIRWKPDDQDKLLVKCPVHGKFRARLINLEHGEGCPECARERLNPLRKTLVDKMQAARRASRADKEDL